MKDEWRTANPPCEEEKYLVQLEKERFAIDRWTRDSWITGRPSDRWHWFGESSWDHVVAWRPLPVPYKDNTGYWEWDDNIGHYICSKCGQRAVCDINLEMGEEYDLETDFCPHCGADMREEKSD